MNDIAVVCEGLSKQYRIGERESYKALRDVLADAAKAPFRRLRGTFGSLSPSPNGDNEALFWALDDVSFEVRRGEVVGIIGRNGAGKTTLLKILSRITRPTRGHAWIHGRVGSLLEVGTGFHPELTGRENIYLNGAILGMRKAEIEHKFEDIVAFAEIDRFIDTPVKRYSSGMYVRLAFAVAAHLDPEILIADEVLAVGDAAFQKKCLGKMGEVARAGRTVLFVSHNLAAIRSLCNEVIWLNEGKKMTRGPASRVIDEYLRTFLHQPDSSIELRHLQRHPRMGERLRMRRIQFNEGQPILHGEPLTVRMEFETASEIHDAVFGVGISSFEGTRLMTFDSDQLGPTKHLPRNTIGIVEGRLSALQLAPGRYTLDLGARSGHDNPLDFLIGCAQLEVLPGPSTPPVVMRYGGGVRLHAHWEWLLGESIGEIDNCGEVVQEAGG